MRRYNPKEIEPKWQAIWEESKIYHATEDKDKPKRYVLEYFPYPSGAAMHVGHVRNYTIGDAVARFARMHGNNVLHPMGWDAFGLPAENYAIKTGISPQKAVADNVERFKKQLMQMGFSYDWSREINSTDPAYYKWTQWLFLLLFEKGLAYQKESLQWWCPHDKTVLANEQVENGRCWRCGHSVEKKLLKQWFFKITQYADRLDESLQDLDWSDGIKAMQHNWIGRSVGAEIEFDVEGSDQKIKVFTTRPDTIFGATFLVLSPEHKILNKLSISEEVQKYIQQAERKSEIERAETEREKTGVFSGFYAVNPASHEKIPIWVADYVLPGYGTGAIMAVPAHDERDNQFAKEFQLPIRLVVKSPKDYEGIDQAALREFTKELFKLSSKNEFTLVLVGGAAKKLAAGDEFGVHSDIDIFVDQKGFDFLEEYFTENKLKSATRDGYDDIHSWNNQKWFWNDKVWVDMFLLDKEKDVFSDSVGKEKYVWGKENVIRTVELDDVTISIPSSKILNDISFNLSNAWNKCYIDEGVLTDSGKYSGLSSAVARETIVAELPGAKEKVNYKMRDWLISRQRYWGAPIPIIHCPKDGAVGVPEADLPVVLPEVKSYEPSGDGQSPLAQVPEFVNVKCPKCGGPAKRETDTMDGFACSSWYFLRFADPHNSKAAFAKEKSDFWLPVDDYIGGAEHAVMHLLYARFWTKVMFDEGLINFDEPFKSLRNHGMILAPDGAKMSKSKGNTIEPGSIIAQGYGADSIRLMELFLGPWDQAVNWSVEGIGGTFRFLQRIWTLANEFHEAAVNPSSIDLVITAATHKTIKKVTQDLEKLDFNTAIAAQMTLVNDLYKAKAKHPITGSDGWRFALESLTQLLAPFAPHIAEEIWHEFLGHEESVHVSRWPQWDDNLLVEEVMTLAVQVNGKVRGEIVVAIDISEQEAVTEAKECAKQYLQGKTLKKAIYVPGRLVSLVVS